MTYLKIEGSERNLENPDTEKSIKLTLLIKLIFSFLQPESQQIANIRDFTHFVRWESPENRRN
jgi:hypothetical protein